MSKPISLFSGYSQKENRVTNYCLLVLKMLYEENPKYLGEVLSALVSEDIADKIGVTFRQQEKKPSSTPDGLILQPAVTVYIETKNYNWFYDSQLEKHLSALAKETLGVNVLLALGKFESDPQKQFERIRTLCDQKYRQTVVFAAASFEDFVNALKLDALPKNLSDAVADFRAFLDGEDLLSSWAHMLDVVNCARSSDEFLHGSVYICPAVGGAYSHERCKYFGMYRQKRVEQVALIEAVVDVELGTGETVKWRNVDRDDKTLRELARSKVKQFRTKNPNDPRRVFLLAEQAETDFRKDSPGGMQSSKRYFDVSRLNATDASDLAKKLSGQVWSEFE
jgi:hypothetical protein